MAVRVQGFPMEWLRSGNRSSLHRWRRGDITKKKTSLKDKRGFFNCYLITFKVLEIISISKGILSYNSPSTLMV